VTRVRSNTFAMAGTFVIQAVFVFAQIKILTHWLDPTQFGLFSSIVALGALLGGVAELGFAVVIVRYGPKFEAEGRPGALTDLLKGALVLWFATGLLIGVILMLSAGPLAVRLDRPGITAGLLGLGFFSVMSFSLRAFAAAVFQGSRRMRPALVMETAYMVGLPALFLLFRNQLGVRTVFWCFLGWSTIVGAGGITAFLRAHPSPGGGAPLASRVRPILKEIRSFWGGSVVTSCVAIALENADRLVLAAAASLPVVAVYHVAARISLFTRKILFIPQQVAKPELAFKWERGARDAVREDLLLFSKLEWVIGVVISVAVVLVARSGVVLASNENYLASEPILVALMGAVPILSLSAPLTTFLRASGHIWVSVTAEIIWLATALGTGLLLLPRFGPAGFGAGTVVAAFLALQYTVWSLKRLDLPRPGLLFFAAHGTGGFLVWGAAALLTRARPVTSVAVAALLALAFALALNVLLVRMRYFTPVEEDRLIGILGPGAASRIGRLVLSWPRGGRPI